MEPSDSRRRFLGAVAAVTTTGLAGCSVRTMPPTDTNSRSPTSLGLKTLVDGLQVPVAVAFAPDADRRYVADQSGVIYTHESGGLRDAPFLDLRDAVEFGGEGGLLGLTLHPNYRDNRRVFVRYSAPRRSGTPTNYDHTFVLSEFRATADGRRADPESERVVLEMPEPESNHNSGAIGFGPDEYLYVGVGDGGGGGDQGVGHVTDWYGAVHGGNGQDVSANLLGSILRIDVDRRADGKAYAVPDDNPLVGKPGRDEQYAWGFRNPWRFSFDGEDLYVGDVGQNEYEEVDLVTKGGNYGWNVKEGTHCYETNRCPDETPKNVRGGEALVDPIVEYSHSGGAISGVSVIGGYVYRGSAIPGLNGVYVFGDLSADGRVFAATHPGDSSPSDGGGQWPTRAIDVADSDADELTRLFSFGRDRDGEMYVLSADAEGDGGVHRLVSVS